MTDQTAPTTPAEAHAAGLEAGREGGVPLHDLTSHMATIGIPVGLRGQWLAGLEDALEEMGLNVEGVEGDGHDWERKALAGIA